MLVSRSYPPALDHRFRMTRHSSMMIDLGMDLITSS
jgi:hypothetical protein